ncbi:MAG TPA: hypothetical protein VK277_08875 [Acidimicrobiales bacterium]|nr:hypothetical protein [Acidimicrobiales bacterium]
MAELLVDDGEEDDDCDEALVPELEAFVLVPLVLDDELVAVPDDGEVVAVELVALAVEPPVLALDVAVAWPGSSEAATRPMAQAATPAKTAEAVVARRTRVTARSRARRGSLFRWACCTVVLLSVVTGAVKPAGLGPNREPPVPLL